MSELRIGVVGYSTTDFDETRAANLINKAFDRVTNEHSGDPCVVSGLSDKGIPKLAYNEADNRSWKTAGVACNKIENYEEYPVDERTIVGSEWGDESEEFLSQIDVLIRVGGGTQAITEAKKASNKNIELYEYNL